MLLVGVPLLRLHGHYLAFGTLALLLMVQAAMSTFDVLGGAFGVSGIPPLGVGSMVITEQRTYAYVALGCLALVLLITHNVIDSRFGRGIRALAGSAGAPDPELRWRLTDGPYFDNQVATLMLDGREATLKLEKVPRDPEGRDERLELVFEERLS